MNNRKLFLTRTVKSAAAIVNTHFNLKSAAARGVNIFAYHRVAADIAKAEREAFHGLVVSTETFRRHCELLKENCEVVSLETARDFLNGTPRESQKPLAVITFDDGYLDFYEQAFPILHEFNLPAVNFLATKFVGDGRIFAHDKIFWLLKIAAEKQISPRSALASSGFENIAQRTSAIYDALIYLPHAEREKAIAALEELIGDGNAIAYPREYQLLDWRQIGEMHEAGVDFGFHTANHVVMPLESETVLKTEIDAGKAELERRLHKKVISFAYPNGKYDERVKTAVAQAGFEIAVTIERKINLPQQSDLLALGRFSICEESTRGGTGFYSSAVAKLRFNI